MTKLTIRSIIDKPIQQSNKLIDVWINVRGNMKMFASRVLDSIPGSRSEYLDIEPWGSWWGGDQISGSEIRRDQNTQEV